MATSSTGADGGFRFPWPFPTREPPSLSYRIRSYATLGLVYSLSRTLFAFKANQLVVHNKERLLAAIRDKSRPLITIANHRCNIDDPLLWACLSWKEYLEIISRMRYTLAAHNICFTRQLDTTMFSLGRCVPCVRGAGVYQQGMDYCIEQLNRKQWVHVFPEGKVTDNLLRFKWGIGRLVLEARSPPVVLPIVVQGMNSVWPTQRPYYPRFGKVVEAWVGEPIDTAGWIDEARQLDEPGDRKLVTDRLQRHFYELCQQRLVK